MQSPYLGKDVGQGKNTYQLSGHGNDQALNAVSKSLEHRADNDAVAGKQKA